MTLRRLRRIGGDKKKEEKGERSRMGIRMVRVIMVVIQKKKRMIMRIHMELKH